MLQVETDVSGSDGVRQEDQVHHQLEAVQVDPDRALLPNEEHNWHDHQEQEDVHAEEES